jgi:hypothetical protein
MVSSVVTTRRQRDRTVTQGKGQPYNSVTSSRTMSKATGQRPSTPVVGTRCQLTDVIIETE